MTANGDVVLAGSNQRQLIVPYTSAVAIREQLPSFDDQLDYSEKLSALKRCMKDPRFAVASIEADAALAQTLDEALKRGDVTCDQGGYQLLPGNNQINSNTVNRWRKVRKVSPTDRVKYYEETGWPTRNGLLRWATSNEPVSTTDHSSGVKDAAQWDLLTLDCVEMPFEDNHFDLVFASPPYESQRSYGDLDFDLEGDEWVQWAADRFEECLRVCKGLVAWVVEGFTKNYSYSASPFLLMAEIKNRGYKLRKPCVYHRNGIPGTGGPDFLRNDWEPIICATKTGKLPWSDNVAMGHKPVVKGQRRATNREKSGKRKSVMYKDPEISNPGNIIHGIVGKGQLGWVDAHENEAPFPEWLAEFFVKSFCPQGGIVLDCFCGSGTTISAAVGCGRNGVGIDVRETQTWLAETRLMGLTVEQRKQGQRQLI